MTKAEQSKRAISEALLRLLKNHEYGKITLQAIVNEAGVSRMAFYRNFESKDAMIKYYLDHVTDDFIAAYHADFEKDAPSEYYNKLIPHLVKHREIGELLIKANLFDYLRSEFNRVLVRKAKDTQGIVRYHYVAGGICNVYWYWLTNGCRESAQELAVLLLRV